MRPALHPALHIACLHTVDSNIAVFEAADLLREMVRDADAVPLTCSTVGPAAELAAGRG